MIIAILLSAALAVLPNDAPREALGSCAWSHVSDADKGEIADAYQRFTATDLAGHVHELGVLLDSKTEDFDAAFAQCDATVGLLPKWKRGVMAAEAEKFGTSTVLATSRHLTRADLDQAWQDAPEAARQCTRADAGKFFGVTDTGCANLHDVFWFITHFGISRKDKAAQGDAELIISYMHAVAEGEVAADLIDRFHKAHPAQSPS